VPILADTSAWVEFDRATGSPVHYRLRSLISENTELAVTEPIVMEVLAGVHGVERQLRMSGLMMRFTLLPFETPTDFEGAADIYRRSRAAGVTPGGLLDCMIAQVALRTGATLLSNDATLSRVAQVIGVELDVAALRGSS
jgi:predicted nucleic acid-binding protein